MEINITHFFNAAAPMDYSASVAEIGTGTGAGPSTWRAALDDAPDYSLLDADEKREAFRVFVSESGGWTDEEINSWSDNELSALFIQYIASDMRECNLGPKSTAEDWSRYETESSAGSIPSRLFRAEDGRVFFYIGS